MVNDPIADALIRIKNGYLASKQEVVIPYSKLVFNLVKLLEKEGYLQSAENTDKDIQIILKYQGRTPVLSNIKRISKPGLRVYKGVKLLPKVLNGLGIAIVSTPKGLMTDREARKEGVGGEVMAYIW